MKKADLLDRVLVPVLWVVATIAAFFVVLWCRLTRHRWDWKEIGAGAEFARRVIHGPPFRCLRCGAPWRHGG